MTLILAQSAPPAAASWLEVLFWLLGGIGAFLGILVAIRSLRAPAEQGVQISPQPLQVREADKFVTHVEFTELKSDVDQIRQEVKDGFRALGDERRTSVGNLHGKIDATNEKVDEMRGEVRLLNQQLQQLLTRQLK